MEANLELSIIEWHREAYGHVQNVVIDVVLGHIHLPVRCYQQQGACPSYDYLGPFEILEVGVDSILDERLTVVDILLALSVVKIAKKQPNKLLDCHDQLAKIGPIHQDGIVFLPC